MAITILAQAVVDKSSGGDSTYTHAAFAVPGGTSRLLVQVEYRGFSSALAPALTSVTHNGDAVSFLAGSATTGGFDDITTWWGQRLNPDIGTFNIVVTFPSDVRGVKLRLLAISGEKASGSILGQSAFQRIAGAATDTVGLGITPAASNDSLLLASLSIAQATTLTTWTGTGWTAVATDSYTGGGNLTSTDRHLLNAPGGAALTVSAKFGASDIDIGGSLIEILAEPTGTDVSGTFGVSMAVTGSVAGGSSASLTDASFRRLAAWTEMLPLQADTVGSDWRLVAAGPAAAPNLAVEQIAGRYRWSYRLTDGSVVVESTAGAAGVTAKHLALAHGGTDGPALYLDGLPNGGPTSGGSLTGITDIGAGGETIGSHPTGTAYTGLVGRYLLADSALTAEQVRLLALSQTDPDAVWGYGVEDDAEESNQSVVACPLDVTAYGQPTISLLPTILDPAGGVIAISGVTQPANGTLAIAGLALIYTPTPGWQGVDSATYTATDGAKSSTGRITLRQLQPSIKAIGDSITVSSGGSITFDPRVNDKGAGSLRIVAVTQGAAGTVTIEADGRVRYRHTGGGGDPDWWKLPIRSGRPWAAGGSFWNGADLWVDEAADTALPDAGTGSSKGFKDSSNPGGANVQTWDGVLGGPLSGGLVSTGTQFDWSESVYYYFGDVVANLPTGAAYPDGSGWLFWTGQFIPTSRRTDTGDFSIWDEISAGTHDAKFVKFGQRVVTKMNAVGHPVKRLIIDFHHEMNQSNIYQVFTGTRFKYKAAMERIIAKVREGAGQTIRFSHRPAYSGEAADEGRIAAYQDWVPSNVDVLALSMHPNQTCDSNAKITQLFNGTLNSNWYGIQEFLDAATALNKPIAFPEWSPKYEVGKACPVSKRFVERFYPEILVPNKDRLVADCVYGRSIRDPSGYLESDTAGQTSWAEMVPLRKTLWSGIKS